MINDKKDALSGASRLTAGLGVSGEGKTSVLVATLLRVLGDGDLLEAEFTLRKSDGRWEVALVAEGWGVGAMGDTPSDAVTKLCSRQETERQSPHKFRNGLLLNQAGSPAPTV